MVYIIAFCSSSQTNVVLKKEYRASPWKLYPLDQVPKNEHKAEERKMEDGVMKKKLQVLCCIICKDFFGRFCYLKLSSETQHGIRGKGQASYCCLGECQILKASDSWTYHLTAQGNSEQRWANYVLLFTFSHHCWPVGTNLSEKKCSTRSWLNTSSVS